MASQDDRRTPPAARELLADADGHWVRHWTSSEWFASADSWVRARLTDAGIAVSGEPVAHKIRFWATVWCYPTDQGLFWFKENNPGQRFEAALVTALAKALPQHVVAPLAVEPEYGWMLTADGGPTLSEVTSDADLLPLWRRLVTEYAELQRDTVAASDLLLASGLTSLEPSGIGKRIHAIGDYFAGLGSTHPLRLDPDLLTRFYRAGDTAAGLDAKLSAAVPLALDQNDLHVHNVFGSHPSAPFRFFDFGDAVWGHPFATLPCVRAALADDEDADAWAEDDPRLDELTDAYLRVWSDYAPLDVLRSEAELVQPLHAVHRLVSWHRLLLHADEVEATAWAATPRYWVAEVVRQFHGSALA